MLTVNLSGITNKYFIMNNKVGKNGKPIGQVPGTPYYNTMKAATIAMFRLKDYKNLYTLSEKEYAKIMANN